MVKVKKLRNIRIEKAILLFMILFSATKNYAQIYASAQTNGANGICIGCAVKDPQNAVDGNTSTYAMAKLAVSVLGANVYQNLNFPVSGNAGEYIGLAIEDSMFATLNATTLNGVQLTTYFNNVSNNDTKTSTQFSISPFGGSSTVYLVQFMASAPFDAVQLQINAGIIGTISNLRVYYAFHSITPLPITLLDFNTTVVNNAVKLNWTTATETDNDYFTIERSEDSQTFYPIEKIKGAGNSTNEREYSFTDLEPLTGVSYYRLKQTDYNGKFEYFKINAVNFKANSVAIAIYPNPTSTNFVIETTSADIQTLQVFDANGKLVLAQTINGKANIDASALAEGVYNLSLLNSNGVINKRLVIVR